MRHLRLQSAVSISLIRSSVAYSFRVDETSSIRLTRFPGSASVVCREGFLPSTSICVIAQDEHYKRISEPILTLVAVGCGPCLQLLASTKLCCRSFRAFTTPAALN